MIALDVALMAILFAAGDIDRVDLDRRLEFAVRCPDAHIDNGSFWNTNFRCAKWRECEDEAHT